MNAPSNQSVKWSPLRCSDAPQEITLELRKEHPNLRLLKEWRNQAFAKQTGILLDRASEDERREFIKWLQFQLENSDIDLSYRKWPRLHRLLFDTYTDKVLSLAQRTLLDLRRC